MTNLYNQIKMKPFRQKLRNNATFPEQLLWEKLRQEQLGTKFRRQYSIANRVVDFYSPAKRLVIEVDGDSHSTPIGVKKDLELEIILEKLDIQLLRFTNDEVRTNLNQVVQKVQQAVAPIGG